jgi:hypothetical protein
VDFDACVDSGFTCSTGGDWFAACIDSPAPSLSHTCFCSSIAYSFDSGSQSCVDHDACVGHLCNAGLDEDATCIDKVAPDAGYDCDCKDGFIVVDGVCEQAACVEHAEIINGTSGVCACEPGYRANSVNPMVWDVFAQEWVGECVAIVSCASSPCVHDGVCYEEFPSGYYCDCSGTGYDGDRCEIDVVDCKPNSCNGKGDPVEGVNECACECFHGWEGSKCSKPVDWCESEPCQHNTRCQSVGSGANSSFSCNCEWSGYTGLNCGVDIDDCASSPCMNKGVCTDDGRHSFTCKCIKATRNTTGYTDSICQTPVYFNDDDGISTDDDDGNSDEISAGDHNWEFIGLAAALLVLLLVLVFLAMRLSLRGKERVFINEHGEAFILNETTGTTKRANFDVDVVGQSQTITVAGPTIDTRAGPVRTRREITLVNGPNGSVNTLPGPLAISMPGGVNFHDMQSSSSELTSSSSDDEMAQIRNLSRFKARRTSIDMLGLAFGDSARLRKRPTLAPMHPHHHGVDSDGESI